MSSADRTGPIAVTSWWLRTQFWRYGFALAVVCIAVGVQRGLEIAIGFPHSFLMFYPTILIVSLLAGFLPGVTATLLSALAAVHFYRSPMKSFVVSDETEMVGLTMFVLVGIAISWLANSVRERANRLQEFEKVVEGLEEMIVVVDRNYRYLIANRSFLDYRGMKRADVIGRRVPEILNPGVFEATIKEKLDECFCGKIVQFEMRYLYPNGGQRELVIAHFPIKGRHGIDRVASVLRDVTEQKRAEAAVRESEDRYRDLVEHCEDLVCTHDLEGRLLSVNAAPARILGYTVEELLQMPMRDLLIPEGRELFDAYLERLRTTGAPEKGLLCVVTKSGEVRTWEYSNTLRSDGVAKPIVRGMAHDITERRRAEIAQRSSEQRYKLLFEKNVAGVSISSMDGEVLECNEAGARILGYSSAEEVRGRRAEEFYFDPAAQQPLLDQLKRDGTVSSQELQLRRKDGTPVWVLFNTATLAGGQDGAPLVQATSFDITKRKQAEDALRQREESYRNFVARSSEGIFRQDVDAPIPTDLPEDELAQRILHDSYMAECNDAIVKMYGLNSVQDFVGRRLTEFVDPNDPGNLELTRQYIRSGFRVVDRESFEADAQGNPKIFRNSMIGIVEDGMLVRTWGIQRDVTEQVKSEHARGEAERALRKSEERFRVALKDSPITVFSQDPDLRYTWIYNPQLHWQQDVLGKTDDELIGPKKAAALNDLKRRVLDSGVGTREEVAIPKNGTSSFFDITIEPLFDAQKNIIGITAACMDIARLREMADRLQESRDRLANTKSYLESEIQTELGFEKIIGQSPALREVLRKARVVAPTDSTVLLLGETGTGKELVARSVHALSARCNHTFVKLNCASVPSGLLESELFGHEKGAFTGAVNQKIGRIELADKGTLFLDEIGEMPPELQPKLLRVLQDREFERLGGIRTLHVDVRIISATNRDLQQNVTDKKFREDLFYRLNVFPIELPPLRDRRDDIAMLVQHFVRKHSVRMGKRIDTIPDDAMRVLRSWNWPGNVRELENVIERMVIMSKGSVLSAPPAELLEAEYAAEDNLTEMEREHILRVLRETNGVLSGDDGAASRLGLKRTTLQSMIKRLGIHAHEYRNGATGTFGRS